MGGHEPILAVMIRNDEILSRTSSTGRIDTTAAKNKRPAPVLGERALELIARNRRLCADYIDWRSSTKMWSNFELLSSLITLAEMVNLGISDGELLRQWELEDRHPNPESHRDISAALLGFDFAFDLGERLEEDAIRDIARIEWEIGIGPLHPFYDGCGRTSRYFSVLLARLWGVRACVHRSREEYYLNGGRSLEAFQAHYVTLERVEA